MDKPADTTGPNLAEIRADSHVLAAAIGGWRGILDSGLPTAVFLLTFVVTSRDLNRSITAAVISGVLIVVLRLYKRQSLQQAMGGFFGLALSAYLASRTGKSENFFVLGIVQNTIYAVVCFISVLIRRPLLGYIVAALRGEPQNWRLQKTLLRRYSVITWLWTVLFAFRVMVTLPLYLANQVTWLGTAKLVLGTPLYVLGVFITYRIVTKPELISQDVV